MASLKTRVIHQRDTLMARGPSIRVQAVRVHNRLRHPVVLIPAFLSGVVIARGAPALLRAVPRVTAQLRNLTEELGKLQTLIRVLAVLAPGLLRPSSAAPPDTLD